MSIIEIKEAQISALIKINFCFNKLKQNPPLKWINEVVDNDSLENTKRNFANLTSQQQTAFRNDWYWYLDRESTSEARMMLIINYLSALLKKGKNNKISIYKNFADKKQQIEKFEEENRDLLNRINMVRDKLYAHIDLNWQIYVKSITFDEFEICIGFLNELFDYKC